MQNCKQVGEYCPWHGSISTEQARVRQATTGSRNARVYGVCGGGGAVASGTAVEGCGKVVVRLGISVEPSARKAASSTCARGNG